MPTDHIAALRERPALLSVVLVLFPVVPVLLMEPLGVGAAAGTFVLGSIAGLLAAVLVGGRFALGVAAVVALANFIALLAAPNALAAGLVMAVVSLLYGLTARRGITSVVVMAPESVAFTLAEPPQVYPHSSVGVNALVVGLAALAGGLWGAGVGSVLARRMPRPHLPAVSFEHALIFGLTLAAVTGMSMGVVVAMQLQHGGAWLMLTLFLVLQPGLHDSWRKTRERVWGTLLGFAIALCAAYLVHEKFAVIGLGLIFLAMAIYVKFDSKSPYWLVTTLLTPGIVLVEGAGSNVVSTDMARLWFTVVGAVIALLVLGVFWIANRSKPNASVL